MLSAAGWLVTPTGCIQSSSSQPMSVSGSPTVVISQSKTALTSPPVNAKLPGLASPCTNVTLGNGAGLLARSAASSRSRAGSESRLTRFISLAQWLSSRSRCSLPSSMASSPVVRGRPSGSPRVVRPGSHTSAPRCRRRRPRGNPSRRRSPVDAFHDEERPSENLAAVLEPERSWHPDPGALKPAQNGELAR